MKIKFALLLCIAAVLASCKKDQNKKPDPTCDSSNTKFNQLFNLQLSLPSMNDSITIDSYTHQYSFKVSNDEVLCQIGYQAYPGMDTIPYTFELFDSTTNSLIYSGNHLLSSLSTTYVSIVPVNLIAGHKYTISRIQPIDNGNPANLTGRLALIGFQVVNQLSFPINNNGITILSSDFVGGISGSHENCALPYIDLVFQ
jgi:hypothetical protein